MINTNSEFSITKKYSKINTRFKLFDKLRIFLKIRNTRLKTKNSLSNLLYHQKSSSSYFSKVNTNSKLISRPLYALKLANQCLTNTHSQLKVDPKNKYSFFNGIEYRKNLLRKFSRISSIRFYKKHSFKTIEFRLSKTYMFAKLHPTLSLPKNSEVTTTKDLLIKRIRFKPGYQSQWRKARVNLKELLLLKFTYQSKLTNFLTRFYRTSHFSTNSVSLLTLEDILLKSKLLPDSSTISFFAQKYQIWLNGILCNKSKTLVSVGDIVQLTTSNWLLVHRALLASWHSVKFRSLKNFSRRKLYTKILDTNKSFRTRSTTMPSNFIKYVNLTHSVPFFLEVDLFSMSTFIISENTISKQNNVINELTERVNIFKNYNWKYLN